MPPSGLRGPSLAQARRHASGHLRRSSSTYAWVRDRTRQRLSDSRDRSREIRLEAEVRQARILAQQIAENDLTCVALKARRVTNRLRYSAAKVGEPTRSSSNSQVNGQLRPPVKPSKGHPVPPECE
jgi:hypothetical protein